MMDHSDGVRRGSFSEVPVTSLERRIKPFILQLIIEWPNLSILRNIHQVGHMRPLQGTVHGLGRRGARSYPSPRHERGLAGRSSGQYSGRSLVVQRGKGIEQRLISGRSAIFFSLHDRIDPETRKRDPHHAGTKKLPWAFLSTNLQPLSKFQARIADRSTLRRGKIPPSRHTLAHDEPDAS